ncbi:response regulator [Streptomyces sp. NPDC058611]|uniref:response regulator n=1 Tax=unclassified Streptomyces TaxID=2593676 RepID=UPI003656C715
MPGKGFVPRTAPEESAADADATVGPLARRTAVHLSAEVPPVPVGVPAPGPLHHSDEAPMEHPMTTTPARPFDVLLVEDDTADAMLIEEALSERGARNLVQVTDGVAALEHLRDPENARPDLIVLDLNMPRMNGRDLLKVLKSDEILQAIPVVVLTTSTAPDDVAGAYSSHANAYVAKPVNLEDFERAVQSIDAFYLDTAAHPPRT